MRQPAILNLAALALLPPVAAQDTSAIEAFAMLRSQRVELRRRNERDAEVVQAIDASMHWLARHQGKNGAWDTTSIPEPGNVGQDCVTIAGMTGLALTVFATRNYTANKGPFQVQVRRAIEWIRKDQSDQGAYCITANTEHALLTWGMVEQAVLDRTPELSASVGSALRFLITQQNRDGGFHDSARGNPSTMMATYWAAIPLLLAARVPIVSTETRHACTMALDKVRTWLSQSIGRDARLAPHVKLAQTFPCSEVAQVAAGLHLRLFLEPIPRDDKASGKVLVDWCKTLPARDQGQRVADPFHSMFGAGIARQVRGKHRKAWHEFRAATTKTMRRDGDATGSYDPVASPVAPRSRMLTTALLVLALQSDMHFAPARMFQPDTGKTRTPRRGRRRRR